jgi:hypothetical protein
VPRRPAPRIEVKLTLNGAVSWPAPLRHRWDTEYLMVEDHGSYAVVRPMEVDDPYAITRQRPNRDTPEARAAAAAKKAAAAKNAKGQPAKKAAKKGPTKKATGR